MINKGASKYDKNFMGQSVLHIAASMDNVELVEFLMKNETDEGLAI
jgi:ankyrin repeat protein